MRQREGEMKKWRVEGGEKEKREEKKISHVEGFQIICGDTLLSRREIHNFPLLKCGLCIVTSFQTTEYGRQSNFTVAKPDKPYLS